MISCKDSVDLLVELLDGELPAEEERRLLAHIDACPPCVAFVKTYKATTGLCRRALAKKMPQELSAKLTDFLRANIKK